MFVDREQELHFLERAWKEPRAALLILDGRRRVGKTELLRVFAEGKRSVFFVAAETSATEQLRALGRAAEAGLGSEVVGSTLATWEDALRLLAARSESHRTLVILDEFPYLVASDPSLPSILQAAWDRNLCHTRIVLVLCGSYVTFMERSVLAYKSPLYGRRTGQYLLQPLSYRDAAAFFPDWTLSQRLEAFATLGGIPSYLNQFDPEVDLWDNIQQRILEKGAFLREEVSFLLMQELREPRIYMAILAAIAEGRTRLSEIAQSALGPGQSNKAAFYLQTLQDLHLVSRRVPITESLPHKSRRSIYRLADPFVRFWFRYVYGELSRLEAGMSRVVVRDRIRPGWNDFVSPIWEEVCREFVRRPPPGVTLPFELSDVGSWWSPQGEVDVVGLDRSGGNMLCGECKWSSRPVGENVLEDLRVRAEALSQVTHSRQVSLALFARSGFTAALQRRAVREGVLLFGLEDVYGRVD